MEKLQLISVQLKWILNLSSVKIKHSHIVHIRDCGMSNRLVEICTYSHLGAMQLTHLNTTQCLLHVSETRVTHFSRNLYVMSQSLTRTMRVCFICKLVISSLQHFLPHQLTRVSYSVGDRQLFYVFTVRVKYYASRFLCLQTILKA